MKQNDTEFGDAIVAGFFDVSMPSLTGRGTKRFCIFSFVQSVFLEFCSRCADLENRGKNKCVECQGHMMPMRNETQFLVLGGLRAAAGAGEFGGIALSQTGPTSPKKGTQNRRWKTNVWLAWLPTSGAFPLEHEFKSIGCNRMTKRVSQVSAPQSLSSHSEMVSKSGVFGMTNK